ncbi:MAG: choice-of-anchor Q domain-containing protein [Thermodesulfobacteriota bacterium]
MGDGASDVIIEDSTFSGNFVEGESLAFAGAIFISGSGTNLEIARCTFNNNRAVTGNGGAALGGAIANLASGITVTVTNSTFSGNSALCGNDGIGAGGAISFNYNESGGESSLVLNNDTFSGNSASCGSNCTAAGDTVAVDNNPRVKLYSSVITYDSGNGNCGAVKWPFNITSLGYNITDDHTCINGSVTGDRLDTDPRLDPAGLKDNGGPTETIAISKSSATFDTGDPVCPPPPSTDQRGIKRPQAAACDVGAYELILRNIPALGE